MPIDLTKIDKINLVKVFSLLTIFETVSIGISFPIYNQFKDIVLIVVLFGMIAPIFLCSSISYLLFRYRLFIRLYDEIFVVISLILILTGLFIISILLNLPLGSSALFLPIILLLISYGIFSWFTNKIVLFLANTFIKMSIPTPEILEQNTLIFRFDKKNYSRKLNSLFIILDEIFHYRQLQNDEWLFMSNKNIKKFILFYIYKDTFFIAPYTNSIYEYDFDFSTKNSIEDLIVLLFDIEKINKNFDEDSKKAFSHYFKMLEKRSVKKFEIRELFPFAKIITIVIIIIAVIVLSFLFYSRIPEFLQYLQDIGVTPYVVSTIVISFILGLGNYLRKFFQKKIFKK